MDPILGLLGSVGGGIINNLFAGSRQEDAQKFAVQQAATAEQYFRTNRQTAYQDTMSDMKAAGLNPILAYSQGASSAPMGTTPSPSQAPVHDIGVGPGVNSALAIRNANIQMEKTAAETNLVKQQEQTERERTANVFQDTQNLQGQTDITRANLEDAKQKMYQAKSLNDFRENYPSAYDLLVRSGWIGANVNSAAAPIWSGVGAISKIPFVGQTAKSINDLPSSRNPWMDNSARAQNRASTADPGFKPGGIRDRSFRGVYGDPIPYQ